MVIFLYKIKYIFNSMFIVPFTIGIVSMCFTETEPQSLNPLGKHVIRQQVLKVLFLYTRACSMLSYIPGLGHKAKKTGQDLVVKFWFNSRHHLNLRFSAEKNVLLNQKIFGKWKMSSF